MLSTTALVSLVIGIVMIGGLIGVILYKVSPKKEEIPSFCEEDRISAKFNNMPEISIDEAVKRFELLDD